MEQYKVKNQATEAKKKVLDKMHDDQLFELLDISESYSSI